jgi:hypothetical protein
MNGFYGLAIQVINILCAFGLLHWLVRRERNKQKFSPFTEPSLRSPGYTLGQRLDEVRESLSEPLLGLLLGPVFYVTIANQISTLSKVILALVLGAAMLVFVKQFRSRLAIAQNLRLGLDGEVYTGQELNFLMREKAYVFHDIPYTYGNIDHVIVSTGGIFVVETKAVRKPASKDGRRQSKVTYENGKLHFPNFSAESPIKQARLHSEYMHAFLKRKTAMDIPVTPVVALPGWFITSNEKNGVLVINPKRGKALIKFVKQQRIPESEVDLLAGLIDEFARTVHAGAEKYNPDAASKYTIFFDKKHEERKIS